MDTDRQAGKQTYIQADKQTGRQTDRQAGRQTGRQADRQAGLCLTLLRLPNPSFSMASVFQEGMGGWKVMSPAFKHPSGTVTTTAAPSNSSPTQTTETTSSMNLSALMLKAF